MKNKKPSTDIKEAESLLKKSLQFIDTVFLKENRFINGQEHPSIADLSCYSELVSLSMIGYDWFENYPNIKIWREKMEKLSNYDTVHKIVKKNSKL